MFASDAPPHGVGAKNPFHERDVQWKKNGIDRYLISRDSSKTIVAVDELTRGDRASVQKHKTIEQIRARVHSKERALDQSAVGSRKSSVPTTSGVITDAA